jgi:outer membrane protein OmpA-like peptidoglycan-associated protein
VTPARAAILALAAALLLGGCASAPPPGPPTPEQRTGAIEALVAERQWLESWFKGTPVRIAQRPDGAIDIDVPLEFCFDAGGSAIRPALAAVLDKLAESLRRVPLARLPLIAAPADAVTVPSLALQRAQQVRDGLRSRGVAEARLGSPAVAVAATVRLHVTIAAS